MDQEKRWWPRYFFFASAELTEEDSQIRVPSRVSELSLHGCYLDMMNPFPVDTVKSERGLGFSGLGGGLFYAPMLGVE
jgi:hypothetical protein